MNSSWPHWAPITSHSGRPWVPAALALWMPLFPPNPVLLADLTSIVHIPIRGPSAQRRVKCTPCDTLVCLHKAPQISPLTPLSLLIPWSESEQAALVPVTGGCSPHGEWPTVGSDMFFPDPQTHAPGPDGSVGRAQTSCCSELGFDLALT